MIGNASADPIGCAGQFASASEYPSPSLSEQPRRSILERVPVAESIGHASGFVPLIVEQFRIPLSVMKIRFPILRICTYVVHFRIKMIWTTGSFDWI